MSSLSDDEHILQVARELCRRLDLGDFYPDNVSWQDTYTHLARWSEHSDRPVTAHYPLLWGKTLILKTAMRGRLEPEEWKPLLASSLIYYRRLRARDNLGGMLRFSPMFLALALFLWGLFTSYPLLAEPVPLFTFIAIFVVVSVLSLYSAMLFRRKMMLRADTKAAETLGKQPLLEVLRKTDSLKRSDIGSGKSIAWQEYGDAPSITKRIGNLERSFS